MNTRRPSNFSIIAALVVAASLLPAVVLAGAQHHGRDEPGRHYGPPASERGVHPAPGYAQRGHYEPRHEGRHRYHDRGPSRGIYGHRHGGHYPGEHHHGHHSHHRSEWSHVCRLDHHRHWPHHSHDRRGEVRFFFGLNTDHASVVFRD